ncbi:hypothetical protein [Wenzhouxiangella marina]|uniref:Uncharacterized protein n=1 Tax=Wenzhouxiangella marina TaxID=1579979 RepID=A0A0K0XWP8_9GAMM|nr:hypothetical protein [Wenzhouxiangella marina]AKS42095.1 hypothetical protein WM2015_1726 [Wenzhouxiangella marina]MBB6086135.1 hypothetical protein [Wenzhouxiangella marina]
MTRAVNALVVVVWLAIAIWSGVAVFRHPSTMAPLGAMLSALAPLGFVLIRAIWHDRLPPEAHPVLVSALSGLGAVIAMVATNRFGEQYEIFVAAAALALVAWLLWVRFVWRLALDRNE